MHLCVYENRINIMINKVDYSNPLPCPAHVL